MTDTITLTGFVATEPQHRLTDKAVPITEFRLACTQRRFDKDTQQWVDSYTNWYRINTFRQLALNSMISIKKGQKVIVSGRLRVKQWENATKSGTAVEVDADSIGHDLTFGTSAFTRSTSGRNSDAGRFASVPARESAEERAFEDESSTDAESIGTDEFPSADAATGELAHDASPELDASGADQYADASGSRTPF
ncbi:MAG: single-stranded DNA-binding protein [Microbacteriaceae bacterium]